MSTLGVFSTFGRYHEYTGGIPTVNVEEIMTTKRFSTNNK